jgi:hypothetical protein
VHKSHHFKLTPSPSVPALQARKAIRLAIDCRSFGNTNASKRPVSAEWKIQSSVVSETNGGGQLAANKGNFSTAASISRRNDGAFLQRVAAAVTEYRPMALAFSPSVRRKCGARRRDVDPGSGHLGRSQSFLLNLSRLRPAWVSEVAPATATSHRGFVA